MRCWIEGILLNNGGWINRSNQFTWAMASARKLGDLFDYYVANQDEIVARYDGKYILIVNCEVVGAYDTLDEGYFAALMHYKPGQFMLHKCGSGVKNYTRVSISSWANSVM